MQKIFVEQFFMLLNVNVVIIASTVAIIIVVYPHMPIGKVWIYRLLFVCFFVCVFVRLRISPPRIKLAAKNFA